MATTTDNSNFLRAEAELALQQARKAKSERIKDLGSPIQLSGLALAIEVRGNHAWIAENTSLIKKIDLDTGKTQQALRGHTAPATSLAFYEKAPGSRDDGILISGSWDKTINVWDAETKQLISSTPAHTDFVKALLVIPSLKLLVSSSSDKIIRFWDLSSIERSKPLQSIGSISAHTRPVETLAFNADSASETSATLFTADTMGIVRVWELTKEEGVSPPRFRATQIDELTHHRTGVNELYYGNGQLWTASSDETVQIITYPRPATSESTNQKPASPPTLTLTHPNPVKALLPISLTPLCEPYLLTGSGDVIRVYDLSTPNEPELLNELDAHWHDVTALRLWIRKSEAEGQPGMILIKPWIISTSLDGTIRKWKLDELLQPPPKAAKVEAEQVKPEAPPSGLTEEEERELAELMEEDDVFRESTRTARSDDEAD